VLLESVAVQAKACLNTDEVYLFTRHVGLYERYGWDYVGPIETFQPDSPVERLYRLKLDKR